MTTAEFHRQLRSLFAFLRILVRDSATGHKTADDYAAHLEGRISALARVQEMLMRAPEDGVDLEEMVCAELLGQAAPERRYRVGGPEVRIAREAATPIALALHELAMNAMKHGAFSSGDGRAEVRWSIVSEDGAPWLRLEWVEAGVALGNVPETHGLGRELIERMLPYELNARTDFGFTPDGVRVEILVPGTGRDAPWRPGETQTTQATGERSS